MAEMLPGITIDHARQAYTGLLEIWAGLFGYQRDELQPVCDTEDWTENVVHLVSAIETGLPVHVLGRGVSSSDGGIAGVGSGIDLVRSFLGEAYAGEPVADRFGTLSDFDPRRPTIFRGQLLRYDPLFPSLRKKERPPVNFVWPHDGRLGNGEKYWRSPILMEALGRQAIVSSGNPRIDPDDLPSGRLTGSGGKPAVAYVDAVEKLAAGGVERLIAKIIFQSKYQNPVELDLDMPALRKAIAAQDSEGSQRMIEQAFYKGFDANLLDCIDRAECFLIQEHIPMESEYRIVVIDGSPVAGAGCIECLSPLFHEPDLALRNADGTGAFDVKLEGKRNDGIIRHDPEMVEAFLDRAWQICDALEMEARDTGRSNPYADCVMDFAWNADRQEVVLVETNPPDNFGLYAMDIAPVTRAIVDRAVSARHENDRQNDRRSARQETGRRMPAPPEEASSPGP